MRTTKLTLLLLLTSGCSSSLYRYHSVDGEPLQSRVETVALGPISTLNLSNPSEAAPPAHNGRFIGHVLFSGGVITELDDAGQQNVAKQTKTSAEKKYLAVATRHVDQILTDAIERRGAALSTWQVDELPALVVSERRGTHPKDGRDNVPLPRFTLSAPPLSPELREGISDQVDAVLGAYIVNYYSHNGGWFLGQEYGTSAGARYRLFVVTWDARTGRALAWTDATTRFLHENIFQPNSGQVDDFMIDAEQMMEKQIRRHLWK